VTLNNPSVVPEFIAAKDNFFCVDTIALALVFVESENRAQRRLKNRIGYNYDMSRTAIESGRLRYR
jgi:hypothetical protein